LPPPSLHDALPISSSPLLTVTTFGLTSPLLTGRYFWLLSPNNHNGFTPNCLNSSATILPDNLVRPLSISAVELLIPKTSANSDWVKLWSSRISLNSLTSIDTSIPLLKYNPFWI